MAKRYLIPRRITQRWEIVPGWGWQELGLAATGAGTGAVLAAVSALIGLPVAASAVLAVLPLGVGVLLALPQPMGGNLWGLVQAMRHYGRIHHLYLFDWRKEDA